jgi:hypothetical protein
MFRWVHSVDQRLDRIEKDIAAPAAETLIPPAAPE